MEKRFISMLGQGCPIVVKGLIGGAFNFITFRVLLSNKLYFNFSVLLYGDFNVQLNITISIIITL